ncbi:hypothetical protein [uncultured Massilia sp.]|uniref:hypothetical protein n=1 Tax=uncultured Massilia sp. TaxID=169973 RepID=UPI0025F9EAA7|nr:hypothetical protein [uncultured Massilia sp.]
MLIVRAGQFAAFEDGARESQEKRLLAHLETHYPEACAKAGERALPAFVGESQARAHACGRYRDASVFPFVEALFTATWTAPGAPAMVASRLLRPGEE